MLDLNCLQLLNEFAQQELDKKRYNKLDYFEPYDFQRRFIRNGATYRQRAFSCGNRVGKTVTGAYEMACHLTGRYPEWWDGYVCEKSGENFIAIGITLQSTADILQKELFGTNDVRDNELMGTGFIPRDAIVFDPMEKDGSRIVSVSIRHVDGGINKLKFHSAADEKKIMGKTLKGVWIDETDKTQCGPLYAQCATRVLTTKGFVYQTFTPENGIDEVIKKYLDAEDPTHANFGKLSLTIATMYDAHVDVGGHITDEDIEFIKASNPEFMWDCRINGIPSAGSGAVYPFDDSKIMVPEVELKLHWPTIAGVDFGSSKDPSIIVYASYDPDGDCYYLWEEHVLNETVEDREPKAIADKILSGDLPNVVVQTPHDGGMGTEAAHAKGMQLLREGCNVFRGSFQNPIESTLEFKKTYSGRVHANNKEVGLSELRKLFYEDRLKVAQSMTTFFKEKRTYFYLDNRKPIDKDDHVLDASRYAIMSLMNRRGSTLEEAMRKTKPEYMASNSLQF